MTTKNRSWMVGLALAVSTAACTTQVEGGEAARGERTTAHAAKANAAHEPRELDEVSAGSAAHEPREQEADDHEEHAAIDPHHSSDPAIVLRWDEQPAELATMELHASVMNTTARAIEVRLEWLANGLIDRVVTRPLHTVTVPAKSSVPLELSLADLPVQSEEAPTTASVLAHYTDAAGHVQQEFAPPRFVTYEAGYTRATVRSLLRQYAVNTERARLAPPTRRVQGRYYDPARDALVEDEKAHDAELAADGVVVLSTSVQHVSDVPEDIAEGRLEMPRATATAQKAAAITICPIWQYAFRDAGNGEDLLLHTHTNHGRIPARRNVFIIGNSSGAIGFGVLNSSGCTDALALAPGSWNFALLPGVSKGDISINAFPTSARETISYTASFTVTTNQVRTINFFFGLLDPVATSAAIATQLLHHSDRGLANGAYRIYAAEGCGILPECNGQAGPAPSACTKTGSDGRPEVWLGPDNSGSWKAFSKYVVGHELGHAQSGAAFSTFNTDYCGGDPPQDQLLCRCDFVTSSNQSHCLNSRELMAPAQNEGWAHFFATALVNNRGEDNCSFTYYKQMITPFGLAQPPLAVNCDTLPKWKDNFCPANDTGTELDWLTFYWLLHNDNGSSSSRRFGFADFDALYTRACGTHCTSSEVTFSRLTTMANTQFGAGSAKATHFINSGANAGVDN